MTSALIVSLFDRRHRQDFVFDTDVFCISSVSPNQLEDWLRHGGRKADEFTFALNLTEYLFDAVTKAHVQHFVGIIEHGHANESQVESSSVQMIKDSTRCSNDDLCALLQRTDLAVIGLAAIDG